MISETGRVPKPSDERISSNVCPAAPFIVIPNAIDALSAEFGGKKKPEETLRNNLRMYLKGRHHVESRTGKGFTDILIPFRLAIIEAKVWTARQKYEDGLVELAEYIRTSRPRTREALFVLFCDDDPLPEVVPSIDQAIADTRTLSGLVVPVVAAVVTWVGSAVALRVRPPRVSTMALD